MISLSIVIPIFNSAKYLNRCIDSVLNQTYKDYEVLLIDDGSTDESLLLCNEYEKKDSRIRVYSHENKGVSYTRNQGILNANGKSLIFIDSDDYLPNDYCEKLIATKKKFGENCLVLTSIKIVEQEVIKLSSYNKEKISYMDRSDALKLLSKGLMCSPVNKLYDLTQIHNNNILFNETLSVAEDFLFNITYLNAVGNIKIITLNHLAYIYMIENSDSLSHRHHKQFYEIHEMIYHKFIGFCRDWNVPEEDYHILYTGYWWAAIIGMENNIRNKELGMLKKISMNLKISGNVELKEGLRKCKAHFNRFERIIFVYSNSFFIFLLRKISRTILRKKGD